MEAYDYEAAVKEDILEYLKEHDVGYIDDSLRQELEDDMFVSDSVTGNASGSYTMSTWQAEENICHNLELIQEACDAFGDGNPDMSKGAEHWDVTIRCYLLNQVMTEVVDEWNTEHPDESEQDEE